MTVRYSQVWGGQSEHNMDGNRHLERLTGDLTIMLRRNHFAKAALVFFATNIVLLAPDARATVINVGAPIVGVSPIFKSAEPICDVPAPPRSAGLVAALRWDLEQRCRANDAEDELRGYQIDYEWDGRRFSTRVRDKPNGNTLPIRLRIN